MPRSLRPAHLVPSGDTVWLVDERWPAAAALDASGVAAVVQWQLPVTATSDRVGRVAVADGLGIVVQDGEQVAWVRRTGSAVQAVAGGLTLTAADPETAWLADMTTPDPGDPGADAGTSEPAPLPKGQLVALSPDGSRTTVPAPAPVKAIALESSDVVVTLAQRPVAHQSSPTSWRYEYPTAKVRVDRHGLRPTDQQIEEHVRRARSSLLDLDRFWQYPDGRVRPLSDGLTDPAVSVAGPWPHTRVVVTLRHPRRPGLLLRRTLPLFDDTGQPIHHDNAEVRLMEDLDTGYLSPAEEAVGGVLDT